MPQEDHKDKGTTADDAHQYQSGDRSDRDIDEWKHREPYKVHDKKEGFEVKWEAQCHCGKVTYELGRDKPLSSKYCHCTTCQRLHGVRFSPPSSVGRVDHLLTHYQVAIPMGHHFPQG